ncbi:class I SAM-dependent methyltransferase [Streptomyces sp. NPDC002004]
MPTDPDGWRSHASGRGAYGDRMFRPDASGEDARIDLGALAYDEVTEARFRTLGVGPGWNCLEIGAGTGSVARLLLHRLGVASVLAVDRDVRFLASEAVPGMRVREADITAEDFTPGVFRLVHARFVLMHLPDRERVIDALSRLVAPGGVLVLSDAVDLTTRTAPRTPFTVAMRAMWRALAETIGTDVSWAPDYPRLLRRTGLSDVAAEIHVPPLAPGSPISRFWADTWNRARSAMLATGLVDEATIDEAVRYLGSADCADLSPGMITAWGWRPRTGREP